MKRPDFEALDKGLMIVFKDDVYKTISKYGYKWLSEYVYVEYCEKNRSSTEIAGVIGKNKHWLTNRCKKWGFPVKKAGGSRFVRFKEFTTKKILKEAKTVTQKSLAKKYNCAQRTIRKIIRGESPYNYDEKESKKEIPRLKRAKDIRGNHNSRDNSLCL